MSDSDIYIYIPYFIILILGSICAGLYFFLLPHRLKDANNQINNLKKQLDAFKEEKGNVITDLQNKEQEIKEYESYMEDLLKIVEQKPNFDKEDPKQNAKDVENFIIIFTEKFPRGTNNGAKANYFMLQDKAWEAYERVMNLQSYMEAIMNDFQNQTIPDNQEQKVENLAKLLKMAMVSYDYVTSFNNPNKKKGQDLNVQILEEKIDEKNALEQAIEISSSPMETKTKYRVIKASLEWTGIKKYGVIFSGYKL